MISSTNTVADRQDREVIELNFWWNRAASNSALSTRQDWCFVVGFALICCNSPELSPSGTGIKPSAAPAGQAGGQEFESPWLHSCKSVCHRFDHLSTDSQVTLSALLWLSVLKSLVAFIETLGGARFWQNQL